MAAAPLAHGGLGSRGDFQFGAALETTDLPQLNGRLGRFWNLGSFRRLLIETEVGTAFFTDSGVAAARLLLDVTAFWAGR